MKDENVQIIGRFFEAVEMLRQAHIIRGLKTLCNRYGWNRWNMVTMRDNAEEHTSMMQPAWIAFLVRDYMFNPTWLLLGEGNQFRDGWDADKVAAMYGIKKKVQIKRKRGRPRKNPVEPQLFTPPV